MSYASSSLRRLKRSMSNTSPVFKKDSKKFTYERPTHFLSVKVQSKTIKDNLMCIIDSINKIHPSMASSIINQSEYHITLFVLNLKTEEEQKKAVELLSSFSSKYLKDYLSGSDSFDLQFRG